MSNVNPLSQNKMSVDQISVYLCMSAHKCLSTKWFSTRSLGAKLLLPVRKESMPRGAVSARSGLSFSSAACTRSTRRRTPCASPEVDVIAFSSPLTAKQNELEQGILKGKYHCTVDLLFDWFGLVCFANKNKNISVVIQLIPNQSNRRSTVQ
jgi:hypothetical protein